MFQPLHLMTIALTAILVPLLCLYVTRGGEKRIEGWLGFLAILILLFDPAYWLWEWLTYGKFHMESTLPLYLCSLYSMLLPVGVFAKSGHLKQMALANVASVGMVSGVFGLILNYHTNYWPFFGFVVIRSLLFHFVMIFGSVLLWVSGFYKPQPGDQWRAMIPVVVLLIPSVILNILYGYDYSYTNGGLGTPFEILSSVLPKPLFLLVVYTGLFLLIWFLFYRKLPLFSKKAEK